MAAEPGPGASTRRRPGELGQKITKRRVYRVGVFDGHRVAGGLDGDEPRITDLLVSRQRPAARDGLIFVAVQDQHGAANVDELVAAALALDHAGHRPVDGPLVAD